MADLAARHNESRELKKTTDEIEPGDFTGKKSEFGRTADVQQIFGLKRGTLYNLFRDGKIRGITLRVRGQKSGVRLWDMDSVRNHILSEMARGAKAKELQAQAPSAKPSDANRMSRVDGNNENDVKEMERPAEVLSRPSNDDDEKLIEQYTEIIRSDRKASISDMQSKLGLGYPRAKRIMNALEKRGIVGPGHGAEPREILMQLGPDAAQQKANNDEERYYSHSVLTGRDFFYDVDRKRWFYFDDLSGDKIYQMPRRPPSESLADDDDVAF